MEEGIKRRTPRISFGQRSRSIKDLDTGVMNWILKFADDTKIFAKVNTASDGLKLQKDLQTLIK